MSSLTEPTPRVAIVDYGLGNLFSIAQAARHAGMETVTTSSRRDIETADAVVLPGVGAFGDAMASLHKLDLVEPLRALAGAGRPVVGLCLGQQLLLDRSEEFGEHEGLGIVRGTVERFPDGMGDDVRHLPLKVPQIGWNRLAPEPDALEGGAPASAWEGTALDGLACGEHVYFVHSYHVVLDDPGVALAWTRYGDRTYCSAVATGEVVAFQFHPERSGPAGLRIYRNIADRLRQRLLSGVA